MSESDDKPRGRNNGYTVLLTVFASVAGMVGVNQALNEPIKINLLSIQGKLDIFDRRRVEDLSALDNRIVRELEKVDARRAEDLDGLDQRIVRELDKLDAQMKLTVSSAEKNLWDLKSSVDELRQKLEEVQIDLGRKVSP